MIPLGYLAKRIAARTDWLKAPGVTAIHAVSGCVSRSAVDLDPAWRQNA